MVVSNIEKLWVLRVYLIEDFPIEVICAIDNPTPADNYLKSLF